MKVDNYDYVINLCNDTPFVYLVALNKNEKKHYSMDFTFYRKTTGKIYDEDMSLSNEKLTVGERLQMEQDVIDYINNCANTYAISTGIFIRNYLINSYGIINNVDLINGKLLFRINE